MALVWFDGFDTFPWYQGFRKYETFGGDISSTTRFGVGQSASFVSNVQSMKKVLVSNQAWRTGFAYNMLSYVNLHLVMSLTDGSTIQATLNNEGGHLVVRGGGDAIIASSARALRFNTWYHIEWYQVIANSISTNGCVVRVDGEVWASADSGDCQNTGNAYADGILTNAASQTQYLLDDWYVFHDSVTTTPTFSGDLRVVQLSPTGDGNYSDFDGSDGNSTNNYQLVDDTTVCDDDSTYVQSDVVSDKDSYSLSNLAVTPDTIVGVAINSIVKKDDAGSRTGRLFFRIGGTDYEGSDFAPTTSYLNQMHLAEVSPDTSTAWTESEVNGMEAGIKVQA